MGASLIQAQVDLSAIAHNVRELRRVTAGSARLMAVVKANGYGHGGVETARTALANGADALGVARIEESRTLRNAGISAPILLFGCPPADRIETLMDDELTATIFSLQSAETLSRKAVSLGNPIRCHIKVDTGMGRLGLLPDAIGRPDGDLPNVSALIAEISAVTRLKGLDIEGIYTHFACADCPASPYTARQFRLFSTILDRLSKTGIDIAVKHAANSAAIMAHPETHLDMVRPGISLYGLYPSNEVDKTAVQLKPAMTFASRIIQLKKVPAGFGISYGCTHHTGKTTLIATVPVGYADGLNRLLSNRGHMLVHGVRAPIVGRVCMDLTMLDVGHIPDVAAGDEVIIFGSQAGAAIHVDEVADTLNTINYEIVTSLSERVPRVYLNG